MLDMLKIYKVSNGSAIDFAAEELKKYLRMMMPRCGEITIERKLDATTDFRLGLMQDFGLDVSEAEDVELDDIIHIDTILLERFNQLKNTFLNILSSILCNYGQSYIFGK